MCTKDYVSNLRKILINILFFFSVIIEASRTKIYKTKMRIDSEDNNWFPCFEYDSQAGNSTMRWDVSRANHLVCREYGY